MDASREHIEVVEGTGGPKARIAGHSIRVVDIADLHERRGLSVDDIIAQFPTISRADVYAALAYYWDHRDELDRQTAEDADYAASLMQQRPGRLQAHLHPHRVG